MTESVSAARALLTRLGQFLDRFAGCFGRQAQREGASRYIQGLLNDSERKSMQPMEARLPESDPASYQRLQHFITHSPWPTTKVWARLRAELPIRTGLLLVDETSFPKHGDQSVAVARQYCGALGKIANCQVAVSTGLLTEQQVWPTTMELYLPEEWAADADRRARAEIPRRLTFRPKWRIALTHVRQVRAAGLQLTGVLADAAPRLVPSHLGAGDEGTFGGPLCGRTRATHAARSRVLAARRATAHRARRAQSVSPESAGVGVTPGVSAPGPRALAD